jgi:TM2 domain-containing membrane protein YozV
MSPFDKVLAIAQLMLLVTWEALGVLAFGWNGWYILAFWFVGLWSFNTLVATAVRTYFKLTSPRTTVVNNAANIDLDPDEDIGG